MVDGEVTFTDDKQQQTWVVDLIDPSVRDYTYRYTNVYEGGVVKTFPEDGSWAKGDPGYITVGEKYISGSTFGSEPQMFVAKCR